MSISTRLLALRNSPILLRLPPYLSALCILVGVGWLLILPLNEYSRQTYISENAILAGQVHTYFGGSEHNVFRAYRQEVYRLADGSEADRVNGVKAIMHQAGLKVAHQPYRYAAAGEVIQGTNVYGLIKGPRADATEAMVLIAAWQNLDGVVNFSGVALALTLARYFARWSIWSKDIIVLIPADSYYGSSAWAEAYHTTSLPKSSSRNISALPIRAGALQGAVAIDYPAGPWGQRFDKLDLLYDGINGALPNLDLLNTAVQIASSQMGVGISLHGFSGHSDSYQDRLRTLLNGLVTQSAGRATGPHSAFMPYHVDAITLKTTGDGWHDEMTLGRITESLFRSINNLLEHLHQSFFFYILLNANRFVSIGNYLPAAMLLAGSFTITALALWVQSGRQQVKANVLAGPVATIMAIEKQPVVSDLHKIDGDDGVVLVPKAVMEMSERHLALPLTALLCVHLLSCLPLYLLVNGYDLALSRWVDIDPKIASSSFLLGGALSAGMSRQIARILIDSMSATPEQIKILQCFSLLLLGAALSMLATLNFSLAFIVGLLASPLSFLRPLNASTNTSSSPASNSSWVLIFALSFPIWIVTSPPVILWLSSQFWLKLHTADLLQEAAKAWHAQGVWTPVAVWCLWWSEWVVGGIVLFSGVENGAKENRRS